MEEELRKITCAAFMHVPAGATIPNGYIGGRTTCTAPSEPGFYTLFELADENNCHVGWEWERESDV